MTPAGAPLDSQLERVVAALEAGEVVAIPTDTVYGLAADPSIAGATRGIFEIKGRPESVALPVLVPDFESALRLAGPLPTGAEALARRWWPGPLTIVVPRPVASPCAGFELGGDETTIGLRCPGDDLVRKLLVQAGPLAVTSANVHGEPPLTTAAEVDRTFAEVLGALLDGGVRNGVPSTVVACLPAGWSVLRVGPVTEDEIDRVLGADRSAGSAPAWDRLGNLG